MFYHSNKTHKIQEIDTEECGHCCDKPDQVFGVFFFNSFARRNLKSLEEFVAMGSREI